ncbi:bromodomain-containing protein 4-like [Drosophila pseudoobscura]|uniref:Bromodomain-containing protein 4-like n=1 Tax=Drosophila pseudoobscura pseudoobscura TaxID=46245 RepID=A0A6I8V3R0_DROPS|nr:bromodomain-containing protein 4 [Drosophila pseudoobscura]
MNDKQNDDFERALAVLTSQVDVSMVPPRSEPKVEPVNGIVQPAVMPPPHRKGRNTNLLLKLRTAVNVMLRDKSSVHFRHPVNAVKQGIYDYHEKIHRPMDLNTIKKRLEYSYYWWGADLLEDIRLIFDNCKTYNSPDSPVFRDAVTLCELFWLRMEKLQPELHTEIKVEPKPKRQLKAACRKPPVARVPVQTVIKVEPKPEEPQRAASARPPPPVQLQEIPCPVRPVQANRPGPCRPSRAQIRSVAASHRGRGRPPIQRAVVTAKPARFYAKPETIAVLPNKKTVKNCGITMKVEPIDEMPKRQGLGVDLTPLDHEIERRHSQSLLRFLRAKRDSWPFNDSQYWAKFGEDPDYDHDEERLDWGILETLVSGKQFEGFDWFLSKIHRMLENAMSCFVFNPSVRTSTQRIHATVDKVIPQYMERMTGAKERAHEGVRAKLETMTPFQKANLFK